MIVTLIEFDKPTLSTQGRTYLKHEITDLPKNVVCSLSNSDAFNIPGINSGDTLGSADITMDEVGIYAEVKPYSDKQEIFDNLMMDGFKIVAAGFGGLNEKSEVLDFRLQYVFLTKE